MTMDLKKVYKAFDPAPLSADETDLYVELDEVRGSLGLVDRMAKSIRLSDRPTCQLLAGHRGSGKSTELRRLERELESGDEKFFVVLWDVSEDIDRGDVDFPDVLIAIVRQLAKELREKAGIELKPTLFKRRWEELKELLGSDVDFSGLSLDAGLAKFSAAIKSSPTTRIAIREALEPRTDSWIEAANDVIGKAILELKKKRYKGLVIAVDGLDKIPPMQYHNVSGFTLSEYLFINRHAQLTALKCHLIYTMPIALAYSCKERNIASLYGMMAPPVVPMTKIRDKSGRKCKAGFEKLRDLIARRLEKAGVKAEDVFESEDVIREIIAKSGGQPRELVVLIRDSLVQGDLPIGKDSLGLVIARARQWYARQLREEHWKIIKRVEKDHVLCRTEKNDMLHMDLLDNRAILQYVNEKEWYGINPLLPERSS